MTLIKLEILESPALSGTEAGEPFVADTLARRLESQRDRLVAKLGVDFSDDGQLLPRLPWHTSFFALPEQQLLAYERHRELSELGRVFQIANRLHDHVDAVVVFGAGAGWHGARALVEACCDPFHNEGSRANRGSKPRAYFIEDPVDNDQIHSLLTRLDMGGYGDGPGERDWALIACQSEPLSPAWRPTADLIRRSLRPCARLSDVGATYEGKADVSATRPIMIEIARKWEAAYRSHEARSLRIPTAVDDAFSTLTPVGLLPAAFLGLDCIQLLVGAAAINENFIKAPLSDNLVLQLVAANMTAQGQHRHQSWAFWQRCLSGIGDWSRMLVDEAGFDVRNINDLAVSGFRASYVKEARNKPESASMKVCHHLGVSTIRTDPIPNKSVEGDPLSQDDLLARCRSEAVSEIHEAGIRQTTITLPEVNTHSLGQLYQLLMLSSVVESSLE